MAPVAAHGGRVRPFIHSLRPPVANRRARDVVTRSNEIATSSSSAQRQNGKQRVVFLGTPEVAADVLRQLLEASQRPDSLFEVCLVVSQPGKPRGRGNRAVAAPSPVEAAARDSGLLGAEDVVCPARASEASFLARLEALRPDLAVTAAYGNMLPQRFLDVPTWGTLNVHPSLLPRYRGAAPVQRALQDGVAETGVSVAYTVLACDAGPVLAQQRVSVDAAITAPELLPQLFSLGTRLLLEALPDVFAGRGAELAVPQDESQVVHAAKLRREEGLLDFGTCTAAALHHRVRAFAGWPGTSGRFLLRDDATGATEAVEVKIVTTRPPSSGPPAAAPAPTPTPGGGGGGGVELSFSSDALLVPCAGGGVLEVTQLQPPTKKVMAAKDFRNGLRGKRLLLPWSE